MISQYTQLTNRYLKSNRRRTLLTILGIVLSVALVSTIGFFFTALQDAEIQDMKNNYGSFHLAYINPGPELTAKLVHHPKTGRSGLYAEGQSYQIGKIKITEMITTGDALQLQPYAVKEGRFPENPREVAVEQWALDRIDPQAGLGDTLRLGDQVYKLVGIIENQIRNQIKNESFLLTRQDTLTGKNSVLLVEVSSKAHLAKAVRELKALGEPGKVSENAYLLTVQGGSENESIQNLYYVIMFVIGIVVVATIAVIYNSFQISVVERVKQFGLLRTIGATPKQIRKLVFREATLLSMVGIPLGLIFGVLAFAFVSLAFSLLIPDMTGMSASSISTQVILISIGVGLVSIYISAFIPARFAGRVSPLVAISSRALITKEKIRRRKHRLVRALLGFEGELAAKNIKRNRKRYRITVFSIVISIVLFVTFSSFIDQTLNFAQSYNESKKIHFSVNRIEPYSENNRIDLILAEKIKAADGVDAVYRMYSSFGFEAVMENSRQIPDLPLKDSVYHSVTWNGKSMTQMKVSLVVYDEPSLEAARSYLAAGKIDMEQLEREHGIIIINQNAIANPETRKEYRGPVTSLRVGDEIELQLAPRSSVEETAPFGTGRVERVRVAAILREDPFTFRGTETGIKVITSEAVGRMLVGELPLEPSAINIKLVDEKQEEAVKEQIVQAVGSNPTLRIVNYIDNNRKSGSAILLVKILLYGFVVVVSCIGSVNIINTITTNIILRKREFATLKSIGLTQKGLRRMIVMEGLLYGFMGTIYGSLIACGFSYIIYSGLSGVKESLFRIPWLSMGIAGAAALLIGYLSVLSPMARIRKENLIDVVREDF